MKNKAFAVGVSILWLASHAVGSGDFAAIQKTLGIPTSVGTVVDAAGEHPQFILIQDIHRHPEAQANIAAMVLHAYHHLKVTTAYLEGAYTGQTMVKISPDEDLRTRLYGGKLSGAEMASAMLKSGELRLEGLEDADVYAENVQAYQAAQEAQRRALAEIKTIRMIQQTLDLSQRRFSDEQLEHLELLARLKLKPAEYDRYLEDRELTPCPSSLAQALVSAEYFYELAERRSDIFVQKADQDRSPNPKIMIVGGFHTAAMATHLRASGKSFVVLAPRVTQSGFDELYARGMQETISALKLH